VTYHEAIQHSCNIYFYMLGQKLGIDRITKFSSNLGLGQRTGIDIGNEVTGNVPSREWKQRVFGEPWYPGETISVSIGQGPLDVTPLQLARAMGMVATGLAPQLHLIKSSGVSIDSTVTDLGFSQENLQRVRKAMWSVVNEYGTGRGAKVEGFDVCGKTGTAQLISRETMARLSEEEKKKFEANAWFVGFAPLDDPEIVVTVIIQRGGSGSSAAAPLAGKILRHYYQKKISSLSDGRELAMSVKP
jgi:penicillin-binding protein 2